MSYDKFKPDDIFVNTIKAHPKQSFFIYNSEVYINQHGNLIGQNGPVTSVPAGYVSLYELNKPSIFNNLTDLTFIILTPHPILNIYFHCHYLIVN